MFELLLAIFVKSVRFYLAKTAHESLMINSVHMTSTVYIFSAVYDVDIRNIGRQNAIFTPRVHFVLKYMHLCILCNI
jgi:hypothetical protein